MHLLEMPYTSNLKSCTGDNQVSQRFIFMSPNLDKLVPEYGSPRGPDMRITIAVSNDYDRPSDVSCHDFTDSEFQSIPPPLPTTYNKHDLVDE